MSDTVYRNLSHSRRTRPVLEPLVLLPYTTRSTYDPSLAKSMAIHAHAPALTHQNALVFLRGLAADGGVEEVLDGVVRPAVQSYMSG